MGIECQYSAKTGDVLGNPSPLPPRFPSTLKIVLTLCPREYLPHFGEERKQEKKWPEELRRYAPTKVLHYWHLTFDIWHLTFDIWHLTFDIWHLTWLKVLTALALMFMILAWSYLIFTDVFWGYFSNLKISVTDSVSHNMDLRDASASKKGLGGDLGDLTFGHTIAMSCL